MFRRLFMPHSILGDIVALRRPMPSGVGDWLTQLELFSHSVENAAEEELVMENCRVIVGALAMLPVSEENVPALLKALEILLALSGKGVETVAFLLLDLHLADHICKLEPAWTAINLAAHDAFSRLAHQLATVGDFHHVRDVYRQDEGRESQRVLTVALALHPRYGKDSGIRNLPRDALPEIASFLFAKSQDPRSILTRAGVCKMLRVTSPLFQCLDLYTFRTIAGRPDCRLKVAEAIGERLINEALSSNPALRPCWSLLITLTDTENSAIWLTGKGLANVCYRTINSASSLSTNFGSALIVLCNLSNFAHSRAFIGPDIVSAIEVLVSEGNLDATMILSNIRGSQRPMGTSHTNQSYLLDKLRVALRADWTMRAYGGFEFSILELLLPWLCLGASVDPTCRSRLVLYTREALSLSIRINDHLVAATALRLLRVLNEEPGEILLRSVMAKAKQLTWADACTAARSFERVSAAE